jgi:hypothetical protein
MAQAAKIARGQARQGRRQAHVAALEEGPDDGEVAVLKRVAAVVQKLMEGAS